MSLATEAKRCGLAFRIEHSHTVIVLHPASRNRCFTTPSRRLLPAIFVRQNALLLRGHLNR